MRFVLLTVLGLFGAGYLFSIQPSSTTAPAVANAAATARQAEIDRHIATENRRLSVKITKWSWKKGGFDAVMLATFTIQNTNTFPVKDLKMRALGSERHRDR